MLQPHNLQSRISELSIGLGGFDFSRRIAGKYIILRRSGRLFSLVFSRLFGKKSANNKTRIYQGESRNDYFRFHVGIYINVIKQLMKIPSYHLQKIDHLNNSGRNWTQPEINTQIIENFVLRHEKPHLSYKPNKISLFRDKRQVRACQKNSIFSVQNPQFMGLDIQPIEFLRFSGKSASSSYKNYPSGPHGLLYYIISKFQEKVDIPLLEKSRVTKIISYENLSEDAPGKNTLYPSYSRPVPANITLNHMHPINVSYLQKSYSVGNSGSEIKRVIHSQQSGMQSFDKERQSSGSPLIKILNETQKERTTIIKRTIHPLLLTHSFSEMAYHEHGINFQYGDNIMEKKMLVNARHITGDVPHISKELVLKKPAIQSNDIVSENKEQLQTDKIIPGYVNDKLLEESRVKKTISYENLSKDAAGKNILYPSYSRPGPASMALYYMHPINISYLQKSYSVGNSGSEVKRVIHSQQSGMQSFIHPLLLTHLFSEMAYHEHGINFQYGDNIMEKKMLVNARHITGDVPHSSKELVLKKPVIQSNDIVSENKEQLQTDKIIPGYVNDNLIKEHLKKISVHEISTIADRVYKIIERKILIEKDRRGLF